MRKIFAMLLILSMLLCGCGAEPAPTTVPTTEATQPPTTEAPTEPTTEPAPVYTNPLSGEVIDAPYTGRVFGISISNVREALPHVGIMDAEIVMEMFVNDSIIRCFALFTDVTKAETIGAVRSTRLMFNDLTEHYSLIQCHAGGSSQVIRNLQALGIDNLQMDGWEADQFGASYRDKDRRRQLGYEHSLMINPELLVEFAASKGIDMELEREYGLLFTEDGVPADGEKAEEINVRFKYRGTFKDTTMKYDPELERYVYWQYDKMMADGITQEPECFKNVVIMDADIHLNNIYYEADFLAGGTGYYACGGKLIPITWTCDGDEEPFRFFTQDGEPLAFNVGNTYMAIVPHGSPVSYQ